MAKNESTKGILFGVTLVAGFLVFFTLEVLFKWQDEKAGYTYTLFAALGGIATLVLYPLLGAGVAFILHEMAKFAKVNDEEFDEEGKVMIAAFFPLALPLGIVYFFCMAIINRLFK